MVASFDLTRYQPPLEYLLSRIDQLERLLDVGVASDFVRDEAGMLLQEVADFCRTRIDIRALEAVVGDGVVDTQALAAAAELIAKAPRVPSTSESLASRIGGLIWQVERLANEQHRLKFAEVALFVEVTLESGFQVALSAIRDGWNPEPLVALARGKVELLSEERRRDLWMQVLLEFQSDESESGQHDALVDWGVLPPDFLEASPRDVGERLAWYHAWYRSRVVKAMVEKGSSRWPIASVSLAKILASKRVERGSRTEVAVARSVSHIAGWLAVRKAPMTLEELAVLLGLDADSKLLDGADRREFSSRRWEGASIERAALYSFRMLASAVGALHQDESPIGVALFQYKAGIELFAPGIAGGLSRDELVLQKELCKFLLERGIFSVGTKFGQNETDLVATVQRDYIVIECKVLKKMPSDERLRRNLMQLLRYDDLNPAFRGRRAVLVLFNFADVPILAPRELVGGRARIVAINASAGPPSRTARCIQIVTDPLETLRCIEIGEPSISRRSTTKRRKAPRGRRPTRR